LEIFSLSGRRVLVREFQVSSAGAQRLALDVSGLARGVYFYLLQTPADALRRGKFTVRK
jgi:hypothetical protein